MKTRWDDLSMVGRAAATTARLSIGSGGSHVTAYRPQPITVQGGSASLHKREGVLAGYPIAAVLIRSISSTVKSGRVRFP
jgi:hypothetical protein